MSESEQQQNDWPTGTPHQGVSAAEGLHTILEFVVEYRGLFRDWMNRRLSDHGSNLTLDSDDIDEALSNLDDLLHVAMDRRSSGIRRVQIPPEVLRMVIERMASITDEDVTTPHVCISQPCPTCGQIDDPDRNTGQYL